MAKTFYKAKSKDSNEVFIGSLIIENSSYYIKEDSNNLVEIDKKTLCPLSKKEYKCFLKNK